MILPSPGGGGSTDSLSLSDVGTTRRQIRHPDDPQADSEEIQPQLQADVTNASQYPTEATVTFYAGGTKVAETSKTVNGHDSTTLAERVPWATFSAKGLAGGSHTLSVELKDTGATMASGSLTIHERPIGGDPNPPNEPNEPDEPNDPSGDDSSDDRDPAPILPEGFPTLPAIGPLTAEQTTVAAAVVLIMAVLLR